MSMKRNINLITRKLVASVWLIAAIVPGSVWAIDYAELYEQLSPAVVTVNTKTMKASKEGVSFDGGVGSGILIEPTLVLTAAHVVDGADIIQVNFKDDTKIDADVISSVTTGDIALLKLKSAHPAPVLATLADSDKTRIGEPVFVIGAPYGIEQTLSIGYLSGRMERGELENGDPMEFLQTDTAINPGNSGGPMFNQHGQVIGVVSFILSKSGGFDGIGFASASNSAYEALMQSTGFWAGFEGKVLTPSVARALNVPGPGLLVQRVLKGSIADDAGLRAGLVTARVHDQDLMLGGDVILEINGLVLQKPDDVRAFKVAARELGRADHYDIKIFRNGEEIRLQSDSVVRSAMATN